jgi:hypothetical protein
MEFATVVTDVARYAYGTVEPRTAGVLTKPCMGEARVAAVSDEAGVWRLIGQVGWILWAGSWLGPAREGEFAAPCLTLPQHRAKSAAAFG